MNNYILRLLHPHLEKKIFQTIFHEQNISNILIIKEKETSPSLNLQIIMEMSKKESFQIHAMNLSEIHQENEHSLKGFDIAVSFFQLHQMDSEKQKKYLDTMQCFAPKAIILDYISPERNIAYPAFLIFKTGECLTYYTNLLWHIIRKKTFISSYTKWEKYKSFMKHHALEKVLYDLQKQNNSSSKSSHDVFHIDKREILCGGGIGLVLLSWNKF